MTYAVFLLIWIEGLKHHGQIPKHCAVPSICDIVVVSVGCIDWVESGVSATCWRRRGPRPCYSCFVTSDALPPLAASEPSLVHTVFSGAHGVLKTRGKQTVIQNNFASESYSQICD